MKKRQYWIKESGRVEDHLRRRRLKPGCNGPSGNPRNLEAVHALACCSAF
jgi:hypothetical protein